MEKHYFEIDLLRSHPETALAHDIAVQLRDLLPIESLAELRISLTNRPLTVDGDPLPLATIEPYLPAEVFPIRGDADLARTITAAVRTALVQTTAPGGPAVLPDPMPAPVLAATRTLPAAAARTGSFAGPPLFGGDRASAGPTRDGAWVVTLELRDCDTKRLLPYGWIFDGIYTYQFDFNGQFIAVIPAEWENYAVAITREGYINRVVVLTQSTMAGTVQKICLNPA